MVVNHRENQGIFLGLTMVKHPWLTIGDELVVDNRDSNG